MAREFVLSIVAPDRSVLDEPVQSVVMPGVEGYFGVLSGHLPLIAAMKAGLVEYVDANNQRHYVAVSGGFAEVMPDKVSILADAAERASDIDISRAEGSLERARNALQAGDSSMTQENAVAEVERAMNRLRVAKMG
jgi:F-type H+-transporting ATPase subunit epsilon